MYIPVDIHARLQCHAVEARAKAAPMSAQLPTLRAQAEAAAAQADVAAQDLQVKPDAVTTSIRPMSIPHHMHTKQ